MQVISFMNMKGGVGKTTLAVNVAYALAHVHKKNVLVVDADPQFNATQYLLEDDDYLAHINNTKKGTLYDVFVPRRPGPVKTVAGAAKPINRAQMSLGDCTISICGGHGRGRLDLLPSTLRLIELDTSERGTEAKLKRFLSEKAQGYDYVIIDCPPTISIFTHAAVLASSKFLVPLKPDPLSVVGLPLLERWLEEYADTQGLSIEMIGLVFTLVRGPLPTNMREVMDAVRQERKTQVFEQHLSQSTSVSSSVDEHQPIFLHAKNSKPAEQILGITEEFIERTSGDKS
jgi:chromosome partitioning protein